MGKSFFFQGAKENVLTLSDYLTAGNKQTNFAFKMKMK